MKSAIANQKSAIGFTLIELLVVITIIVVLLALLVPAMDKAIYQTELATCGARLKAIGMGVTTYAIDQQRSYPYRAGARATPAEQWFMNYLAAGATAPGTGQGVGATYDERRVLKGYIDFALFVDPLCTEVDVSIEGNDPDTWVMSSYSLWYGWQYVGQEAMARVGDRFSWRVTPTSKQYFSYLATDIDSINPSIQATAASHPDRKGILVPIWAQGGSLDYAEGEALISTYVEQLKMTYSWWRVTGTHVRGDVDLNAATADGAVVRTNDVQFADDERMVSVPVANTAPGWPAGKYHNIPQP